MTYPNLPILAASVCILLALAPPSAETGNRPPRQPPPAHVVMTGQHCLPAPQTWTATWISTPDQLRQFISRCRMNRIDPSQGAMPVIDFKQSGLLAVEMGRKSTSGYGFVTGKTTAEIKNKNAILKLEFFEPDPRAVTAQMETSPWILIQLPIGPYREIRVLDQNDHPLARIDPS